MIQDIIGITGREIDNLNALDYLAAGQYAWLAYNQRRVDLGLGKGKETPKQKEVDWRNLNPVYQEIQRKKRAGLMPDRFKSFIETGEMK